MNYFNQRLLVLISIVLCSCSAWSQFSNYFEIHATAMAEVNSQIYELNQEKKPSAAIDVAAKALGNLAKEISVIPEYNTVHVFEVSFDDAVSTRAKAKLNAGDIFGFQMLSDPSKLQIITGLEQKYSSFFFNMALQMKRFKFHYANALALNLKHGAATAAAETKAIEEIVSALSHPFLLKNSKSGITYIFELSDILSSAIGRTEQSTEFSSINSRLTDLYVEIATNSKNSNFVAAKSSKKPNALTNKLYSEVQFKKVDIFKTVMATEGNRPHAN